MSLRNILMYSGLLVVEVILRCLAGALTKPTLPRQTCHVGTQTETDYAFEAESGQRDMNEEWREWEDIAEQRITELFSLDACQMGEADEQIEELQEDSAKSMREWDSLHAFQRQESRSIIKAESGQQTRPCSTSEEDDQSWEDSSADRENDAFQQLRIAAAPVGGGEGDSVTMESDMIMREWERETV